MLKGRTAFTLIEVMVSVVIISIVIMALLEMFSNNAHIFLSLKNKTKINQYSSFFVSNMDHGFENDDTTLYMLIEDFPLEDDLRRKLKELKVEVLYQVVDTIDMNEFQGFEEEEEDIDILEEDDEEKESNSDMIFEVGKTILKTNESSVSLLRLQVQ